MLVLTSLEISNALTSLIVSWTSPSAFMRKWAVVMEFDTLGKKDGRRSGKVVEVISTSPNLKNSAIKKMYSFTMSNAMIRHWEGLLREFVVYSYYQVRTYWVLEPLTLLYFPSRKFFAIRQKLGNDTIMDSETFLRYVTTAPQSSWLPVVTIQRVNEEKPLTTNCESPMVASPCFDSRRGTHRRSSEASRSVRSAGPEILGVVLS